MSLFQRHLRGEKNDVHNKSFHLKKGNKLNFNFKACVSWRFKTIFHVGRKWGLTREKGYTLKEFNTLIAEMSVNQRSQKEDKGEGEENKQEASLLLSSRGTKKEKKETWEASSDDPWRDPWRDEERIGNTFLIVCYFLVFSFERFWDRAKFYKFFERNTTFIDHQNQNTALLKRIRSKWLSLICL